MPFQDDLNNWYNPADRVHASSQGTNLPYFREDREMLQGRIRAGEAYQTAPQLGANPFDADNRAFLSQLQNMAAGRGPSIAQGAYQQASQEGMAQQAALARIGGAAGARQASMNQGRIQQGMAQGLGQARTAEQVGALGQLGGALNMVGQQGFQREALNAQLMAAANQGNQQAYLNLMAQKLGMSGEQLKALMAQGNLELGAAGLPQGLDKVLTAGATVGGFIVGGPAGGAAGYAAGNAAGDAMK